MNILKEYKHFNIYDYDKDMRDFVAFLHKNYPSKPFLLGSFEIFNDDGSYKAPSGKYISFEKGSFYFCAYDLLTIYFSLKPKEMNWEYLYGPQKN